jgi:hypothetical protein
LIAAVLLRAPREDSAALRSDVMGSGHDGQQQG